MSENKTFECGSACSLEDRKNNKTGAVNYTDAEAEEHANFLLDCVKVK